MMSTLIKFFLALVILLGAVTTGIFWGKAEASDDQKYYLAIRQFSDVVNRDFGYQLGGEGGSANEGVIKTISLVFDAPKFSGNDQAKKELIQLGESAIQFFNSNAYVMENRSSNPITWENLDIGIIYKDEQGNRLVSPNLWALSARNGVVVILFEDPKEKYKTEVVKEPLEEVIQKVKPGQ